MNNAGPFLFNILSPNIYDKKAVEDLPSDDQSVVVLDSLATEARIEMAARDGRSIEIRGYTFSERFRQRLALSLGECLRVYDRAELLPVVQAVAQELCLWASLANMRQVYFGEYGLDLNDPRHLEAREPGFQASVTLARERYYSSEIKARGLYLHARLVHSDSGMRIEVRNNATHSAPIEEQLRGYLARAMSYTSIMEYYEDHPEDQDGRGVGLALSLLMLREESLRPELMRLGQSGDATISRLEIPFDASYASIRDRIERGEDVRPFRGHSLVPPGVAVQEHLHVRCPLCENEVDERVFFPSLSDSMVDFTSAREARADWNADQGACASCLAVFSP